MLDSAKQNSGVSAVAAAMPAAGNDSEVNGTSSSKGCRCSSSPGRRSAAVLALVAVLGIIYTVTGFAVVEYAGSVLDQALKGGNAQSPAPARLFPGRHDGRGGSGGAGNSTLPKTLKFSHGAENPSQTLSSSPEPAATTPPPQAMVLDPAKCVVPLAVQQCLLKTYPVWEPDCSSWKGKPASMKGWPGASRGGHECTLQRRSKETLVAALNRTQITFIGDSTSRRAGLAAYITITGASWNHFDKEGGHHDFHRPVVRPSASGDILFSNVVSWWSAFVPQEVDRMKNVSKNLHPPYLAAHLGGVKFDRKPAGLDRLVIVIGATTWDFLGIWRDKHHDIDTNHPFIETWSNGMAEIVGLYKSLPGFDATRDMVIVRLPVGQGCVSREYLNHCYNNMTGPSVNDFVIAASEKLQTVMSREHPDVPLLPMAPWTVADNPDHGRHECVPSDNLGTHMTAPESLYGYSEMVMNAIITVDEYRRNAGCDWQAFPRSPQG